MSEYINQHEIDAVARELATISPELRIEGVSIRNDRAEAVYVRIMEKGNKPLIDKLLAAGFVKTYRKKVDDGRYFAYDGDFFALTFKKNLNGGGYR